MIPKRKFPMKIFCFFENATKALLIQESVADCLSCNVIQRIKFLIIFVKCKLFLIKNYLNRTYYSSFLTA